MDHFATFVIIGFVHSRPFADGVDIAGLKDSFDEKVPGFTHWPEIDAVFETLSSRWVFEKAYIVTVC